MIVNQTSREMHYILLVNPHFSIYPYTVQLSNINLLHLMVDTEMGNATMEHVLTLFDTRYNKAQATMSNSFNAGWKKPSANWFMNVETPSLNYYQNYTGIYTKENGVQLFYEYSQDSFMTDLLDFTEISKYRYIHTK